MAYGTGGANNDMIKVTLGANNGNNPQGGTGDTFSDANHTKQLEMQMGNYETMPDHTIRPWLTLDRHMQILRALWDQKPSELFPLVQAPTLIAAAPAPSEDRQERKLHETGVAMQLLPNARIRWYNDSVHDIHVDQPDRLAGWFLENLDEGFFG